jgi:hypothetical protein
MLGKENCAKKSVARPTPPSGRHAISPVPWFRNDGISFKPTWVKFTQVATRQRLAHTKLGIHGGGVPWGLGGWQNRAPKDF